MVIYDRHVWLWSIILLCHFEYKLAYVSSRIDYVHSDLYDEIVSVARDVINFARPYAMEWRGTV